MSFQFGNRSTPASCLSVELQNMHAVRMQLLQAAAGAHGSQGPLQVSMLLASMLPLFILLISTLPVPF